MMFPVDRTPPQKSRRFAPRLLLLNALLWTVLQPGAAIAQSVQVGDPGTSINTIGNQINVTGNQVAGKNQFHHFQIFNVEAGKTVNFIPNNAAIENILSRVSGGSPSEIFGRLQAEGNVNLFLMNPAGIIFGKTATLDLNGAFTATTANSIGFGGASRFNAIGVSDLSALTASPIEFNFSNALSGAIVNQGNLTLPGAQAINLLGGTVINTGTLKTSGGNITIVAVEGGKAINLSTPNDILSYTIPIDAALAAPKSLPELLTGAPLDAATGIEIKNGVVTLVRSQTPLPNPAGLAILNGTISTTGTPGAPSTTLQTIGQTIVVIDPLLNLEKGLLKLNADKQLLFEDLDDDNFDFGSFTRNVILNANLTNGIIKAIDPKDTLSLAQGQIVGNTRTIELGNLNISAEEVDRVALQLFTIGNLTAGDISTNRGAINLRSTQGDIKVGHLLVRSPALTQLATDRGNIQVKSIQVDAASGTSGPDTLVLDIFAGGTFRAIDVIGADPSNQNYSFSLKNADSSVFNFLANKTGKTVEEVKTSLPDGTNPRLYVESPVSISVNLGALRIRYAGGTGSINTPTEGVTLQGDRGRFEAGAKETVVPGDRYVPRNAADDFSTFTTVPFDIKLNSTFKPIVLSEGASGTVGAIVRGLVLDGSLSISLQDRAFDIVPTQTDKPIVPEQPSSAIPVLDRERQATTALTSCSPGVLVASVENNRSPEFSTAVPVNCPGRANPDDELLKILK